MIKKLFQIFRSEDSIKNFENTKINSPEEKEISSLGLAKPSFSTSSKRKILIVDDEETNLAIGKAKIEKFLPNIACDTANNGYKAIDMLKENKYQLILLDITMPNMNGIEAARRIRETIGKEIPIIAHTSKEKDEFFKEAIKFFEEKNKLLDTSANIESATDSSSVAQNLHFGDFSDYMQKPGEVITLCRTISKWLIGYYDDFPYLGATEEDIQRFLTRLKGKEIILADDEQINRTITKRILENRGVKITEVKDGEELLNVYKLSLDQSKKTKFNAIITDIGMPPHNGDIAAQEIRKIEQENGIKHQHRIPIIALSSDSSPKDIFHFFHCQMNDYFIKGSDSDLLTKVVAIATK